MKKRIANLIKRLVRLRLKDDRIPKFGEVLIDKRASKLKKRDVYRAWHNPEKVGKETYSRAPWKNKCRMRRQLELELENLTRNA